MNYKSLLNRLSKDVQTTIGLSPMITMEVVQLASIAHNGEKNVEEFMDALQEIMASVFSVTVKAAILEFVSEDEWAVLIKEAEDEKVAINMEELEKEIFNG